MKLKVQLVFLLLLALGGAACGPTESAKPAGSGDDNVVIFSDVNVIPMNADGVLAHQTVVVRNDRIESVGPADSAKPPQGRAIEASGKYLMPGLAEMHGHIPPPTDSPQYIEDVLFLYVANGVTTVRGMLGWPGQLELREKANRGEILSPTLYLAGPSFNGNSINSAEEAVEKVRQQKSEGWDLLKVHPGLTREEYDAMARTADEVGIRFAGHVPADVGLLHALEKRQETFDHLDGYIEFLTDPNLGDTQTVISDEQLADAARRTVEAGASVVPTMALWETILGAADLEKMSAYPELQYMPDSQVENWKKAYQNRAANPQVPGERAIQVAAERKRLLKALHDGGVPILLGTDAPQLFSVPGFSIHREVQLMLESGLTPAQILRSGTVNVGRYFASKDQFGAVAAGQRADLILLDANPLEDLGNLRRRAGVMVRGRWLPESEIQERLAAVAAR